MTRIPPPPEELPHIPAPKLEVEYDPREPIDLEELRERFAAAEREGLVPVLRPALDLYKPVPPSGPAQTPKQKRNVMTRVIRPFVLALLAVLSAVGLLPEDLKAAIEQNADAVISGILAVWAIISYRRNREEKSARPAPAG